MSAGAEYDLTATLSLFLDRHLIVPLLDFLAANGIQDEADVNREKLKLLDATNMVDTAAELYSQVNGKPAPASYGERRTAVVGSLESMRSACQPLLAALQDADLVRQLQAEKIFHVSYLSHHHGATPTNVEALYPLARAEYDCGNYAGAAELLQHYMHLGADKDKAHHAQWGRLAALILAKDWDSALREVERLRESIEQRGSRYGLQQQQAQQRAENAAAVAAAAAAAEEAGADPAAASAAAAADLPEPVHAALIVEQRAWLLHWSLFVFFNHPNGRVALVDFFLQDQYAACVTQAAPHLLRYLAAACVTEPRRRNNLRDVLRLAALDDSDGNATCGSMVASSNFDGGKTADTGNNGALADPVLAVLERACTQFDLGGACALLPKCDAVLASDFFLVALRDEFAESVRAVAFESHCRVHGIVSIDEAAAMLGVQGDAAERWVVDLIRSARLDARIDERKGEVVMARHEASVHQTVVERTKGLSFRSATIGNYIAKRMAEVAAIESAAAAAAGGEGVSVGND